MYSDRGYPYAELGNSEIIGTVPSYTAANRPNLKDIPNGVLIHNLDTGCLELSDSNNQLWITVGCGSFVTSGSQLSLGTPTDGTYTDGALPLNPSGTISDAIDEINEYLLSTSVIVLASHLGTTDGNTNGFLIDPAFAIGRVASPTSSGSPFYTGSWDDNSNRDITQASSITWSTTDRITDLQGGTVTANYIDGAGATLHTELLAPDGSLSNQSSTVSGYITITGLISKGTYKEGYLSINIPINTFFSSNSGYLKIEITHTVGSNVYQQDLEFFKDAGNSPAIVSQSMALVSAPIKYLSGIKFATISGVTYPIINFDLSVSGVWADTYRSDPVLAQTSNFGIPNYTLTYNSAAVTKAGISPPTAPFKYNEDFIYDENRTITAVGFTAPDENNSYPQVRFVVRDPFNTVNGVYFGPVNRILVNTYGDISTDNAEYFQDEDYRVKVTDSGITTLSSINGTGRGSDAWDSLESLIVNTGLQVINGALIYPQEDFSATSPVTNPNYIPAYGTGNRVYLRRFKDLTGAAKSNGVLRIDGLTESDRAAGNILVDIKVVGTHIPGDALQGPGNEGTGWLSLNTNYNSATFLGDDGDGCFTTVNSLSSPYFEFTLGGFSTAYAGNNAILIRLTFKDPDALSKRITGLEITDWS
jgi:hypothetical protein